MIEIPAPTKTQEPQIVVPDGLTKEYYVASKDIFRPIYSSKESAEAILGTYDLMKVLNYFKNSNFVLQNLIKVNNTVTSTLQIFLKILLDLWKNKILVYFQNVPFVMKQSNNQRYFNVIIHFVSIHVWRILWKH